VLTRTKEEGVQFSSMYDHLTVHEDEMRSANGFINYVHMEECIYTNPNSRPIEPVAAAAPRTAKPSVVEKAQERAAKRSKQATVGRQGDLMRLMRGAANKATAEALPQPVGEVRDCAAVLIEKRFSGTSLTLPLLTGEDRQAAAGTPFKTTVWQHETGNRSCYTHIATAIHSMAVARFLDALVLVPVEDIVGVNVDCFYLTEDHTQLLQTAGFMEMWEPEGVKQPGYLTKAVLLEKPLNAIDSDCALNNFNPDREELRLAMELDSSLKLINPIKWTAEKDNWR
jgi:hypothetical protein